MGWLHSKFISCIAKITGKTPERVYIENTFHSPKSLSYAASHSLEITPHYHHFFETIEKNYNDKFLQTHSWFDITHVHEDFDDIVHDAIEFLTKEAYLLKTNPKISQSLFPQIHQFQYAQLKSYADCDAINTVIENANNYLIGSLPALHSTKELRLESMGITRLTVDLQNYIINSGIEKIVIQNVPLLKWPQNFLCGSTPLVELILENTDIKHLPTDFLKNAPRLKVFSISGTYLHQFPHNMFESSQVLQKIRFTGNEHLRKPVYWPSLL